MSPASNLTHLSHISYSSWNNLSTGLHNDSFRSFQLLLFIIQVHTCIFSLLLSHYISVRWTVLLVVEIVSKVKWLLVISLTSFAFALNFLSNKRTFLFISLASSGIIKTTLVYETWFSFTCFISLLLVGLIWCF